MTTKIDLLPVYTTVSGGRQHWFSPCIVPAMLIPPRPGRDALNMATVTVETLLAERAALLALLFEIHGDLQSVKRAIDVHAPRRINSKINKLLKTMKDSYAIPDPDTNAA